MPYRIRRRESVEDALRRIADEQLCRAATALGDSLIDDPAAAIHDCRKRCKKVRGLVRLVRPALGKREYRVANDTIRDAARELGPLRDASATLLSFQTIASRSEFADHPTVQAVGARLAERGAAATSEVEPEHPGIRRAADLLAGARAASQQWELDDEGWDAIGPGLSRTYRSGRRALDRARSAPTADHVHEWRKRVKNAWYHARLLERSAPTVLGPMTTAWGQLSDALGDAHDCSVLAEWLIGDDPALDGVGDVTPVVQMLAGFREVLERRAFDLGALVYAEHHDAYTDRLGAYWAAWHEHGSEPEVGSVEEVWPS